MLSLTFLMFVAVATDPSASTATEQASKHGNGPKIAEKMVCKRPEPPLGSMVRPKRVCMKQSEVDAAAREYQQAWEHRQQAPSGNGSN